MNIGVLCTDPRHPVMASLNGWVRDMRQKGHVVELAHDKAALATGDMLFLVSCTQIIGAAERRRYPVILVLHASDLPHGRGWSPHVWAILGGANEITVSLLEADDPVDSGAVWLKARFTLEGHELLPEINAKLFAAELALMTQAVEQVGTITPVAQSGGPYPSLRKRTPEDSRLDPHKSIAEQFDLLRVADTQRYPAFLDYRGTRYRISIEKYDHE